MYRGKNVLINNGEYYQINIIKSMASYIHFNSRGLFKVLHLPIN